MGYDLVTWAPRIGGGGDSDYDVSGGTLLSGSLDTGNPTVISAGDASGFSATPTIAQINASSHFNQVIGAINRRILLYNAAFGSTTTTLAYLTADTKITAALISAINSKINAVRALEGFGSYTFPGISAGNVIKGTCLAHQRKALRISGIMTKNPEALTTNCHQRGYSRTDGPYGTGISETNSPDHTAGFSVGKTWNNATSRMVRGRMLMSFPIPDWMSDFNSADVTIHVGTIKTDLEGFDLELWASNSDDSSGTITPAYSGVAYNFNNLQATVIAPAASTQYVISLVKADVLARAGSYLSLIFATTNERLTAGAGSGASSAAAINTETAHSDFHIDFGS